MTDDAIREPDEKCDANLATEMDGASAAVDDDPPLTAREIAEELRRHPLTYEEKQALLEQDPMWRVAFDPMFLAAFVASAMDDMIAELESRYPDFREKVFGSNSIHGASERKAFRDGWIEGAGASIEDQALSVSRSELPHSEKVSELERLLSAAKAERTRKNHDVQRVEKDIGRLEAMYADARYEQVKGRNNG